uniref:Uncharacterized protein n=1 Tax=Sphaerodactylus townsendi TaxID=933632 RepID=A0ACB8E8J8_9SAUR
MTTLVPFPSPQRQEFLTQTKWHLKTYLPCYIKQAAFRKSTEFQELFTEQNKMLLFEKHQCERCFISAKLVVGFFCSKKNPVCFSDDEKRCSVAQKGSARHH